MSTRKVYETLHPGYYQSFDIQSVLVEEKTKFQDLMIFESAAHGRVLVLDDIIQLTELDEFTYSEMLAHLPIVALDGIENAMIVGGGDGAVAEEILKHSSVKHVDLVDIDDKVIEHSKTHLPKVHNGAFDDPRLSVHAVDAFEFLAAPEAAGRYDLIIADRPDPVGPAEILFGETFYSRLRDAMTPRGVAVFQTGVPIYQGAEFTEAWQLLASLFPQVGSYVTVTPTYIGGHMSLMWASKETDLAAPIDLSVLEDRFSHAGIETGYYSPAMHQAAFALPPFIERLIPRNA